jgi:AcrR family transcriptional regulator
MWDAGAVTTPPPGLRERKKQATREALREAALRLAVERGPDQVRVEDIAEAAGVSPRTYNNYFASREQAIVAAITADRDARVAAAVAARPAATRLADAVTDAVVEQYTHTGEHGPEMLLLITTRDALRDAFLDTTTGIEPPLTAAIAKRLGDGHGHSHSHSHSNADGSRDGHRDSDGDRDDDGSGTSNSRSGGSSSSSSSSVTYTARILAASVAAAVRIALEGWLRPGATLDDAESSAVAGLVIPSGSLADLLRMALAPLAPAFDAAEGRTRT